MLRFDGKGDGEPTDATTERLDDGLLEGDGEIDDELGDAEGLLAEAAGELDGLTELDDGAEAIEGEELTAGADDGLLVGAADDGDATALGVELEKSDDAPGLATADGEEETDEGMDALLTPESELPPDAEETADAGIDDEELATAEGDGLLADGAPLEELSADDGLDGETVVDREEGLDGPKDDPSDDANGDGLKLLAEGEGDDGLDGLLTPDGDETDDAGELGDETPDGLETALDAPRDGPCDKDDPEDSDEPEAAEGLPRAAEGLDDDATGLTDASEALGDDKLGEIDKLELSAAAIEDGDGLEEGLGRPLDGPRDDPGEEDGVTADGELDAAAGLPGLIEGLGDELGLADWARLLERDASGDDDTTLDGLGDELKADGSKEEALDLGEASGETEDAADELEETGTIGRFSSPATLTMPGPEPAGASNRKGSGVWTLGGKNHAVRLSQRQRSGLPRRCSS